jgi:hypothetical protein
MKKKILNHDLQSIGNVFRHAFSILVLVAICISHDHLSIGHFASTDSIFHTEKAKSRIFLFSQRIASSCKIILFSKFILLPVLPLPLNVLLQCSSNTNFKQNNKDVSNYEQWRIRFVLSILCISFANKTQSFTDWFLVIDKILRLYM